MVELGDKRGKRKEKAGNYCNHFLETQKVKNCKTVHTRHWNCINEDGSWYSGHLFEQPQVVIVSSWCQFKASFPVWKWELPADCPSC